MPGPTTLPKRPVPGHPTNPVSARTTSQDPNRNRRRPQTTLKAHPTVKSSPRTRSASTQSCRHTFFPTSASHKKSGRLPTGRLVRVQRHLANGGPGVGLTILNLLPVAPRQSTLQTSARSCGRQAKREGPAITLHSLTTERLEREQARARQEGFPSVRGRGCLRGRTWGWLIIVTRICRLRTGGTWA